MSDDKYTVLDCIPDDGYTEAFYIKAIPRVHGAVRGRFRPMEHSDRCVIRDKWMESKGSAASRVMVETIARRIHEWDLKDKAGVVKLTYEAIAKSKPKPQILDRLFNIVMGFENGDDDPLCPLSNSQVDAEYDALTKGSDARTEQQEADAKN